MALKSALMVVYPSYAVSSSGNSLSNVHTLYYLCVLLLQSHLLYCTCKATCPKFLMPIFQSVKSRDESNSQNLLRNAMNVFFVFAAYDPTQTFLHFPPVGDPGRGDVLKV